MTYEQSRLAILVAMHLGSVAFAIKLMQPRSTIMGVLFGAVCGVAAPLAVLAVLPDPNPASMVQQSMSMVTGGFRTIMVLPVVWVFCGVSIWCFVEMLRDRAEAFSLKGYLGLDEDPPPGAKSSARPSQHARGFRK